MGVGSIIVKFLKHFWLCSKFSGLICAILVTHFSKDSTQAIKLRNSTRNPKKLRPGTSKHLKHWGLILEATTMHWNPNLKCSKLAKPTKNSNWGSFYLHFSAILLFILDEISSITLSSSLVDLHMKWQRFLLQSLTFSLEWFVSYIFHFFSFKFSFTRQKTDQIWVEPKF